MAKFVDLLGDKLVGKDGEIATQTALEGKVVALYFSAHWCPPCRGFTPKLADWYKGDLKDKGLEIIFVSSDKGEAEWKDYYKEHPWLALPYEDRDRKAQLSKKYKVQGIPSLVILDSDAEIITKDGREAISEDPKGANFPWRPVPPPALKEQLGKRFLKDDSEVGHEAIDGKVLMLYFSAHWCPPCRAFTPMLAETYKKYKAKGLNVEVLFVSSDQDEGQFKDYFKEMPWLALPYEERAAKEALSKRYGVRGIPSLVIVDQDGNTITTNGRAAVQGDPEGDEFPWLPKPVKDLASPEGIEETPSLVVFMESLDAETQKSVISTLDPIAKKYGNPGDDAQYLFFAAKNSSGPVPRVRELMKLPEKSEGLCMHLLDLDDDGSYYVGPTTVTAESVIEFLGNYEAKKLEKKQCGA